MEQNDPQKLTSDSEKKINPWRLLKKKERVPDSWLSRFDNQFSLISSVFFKVGIWIFVLVTFLLLIKEIRADKFVIETFEVPKVLEEKGYSGIVMANLLFDGIQNIKRYGVTVRETKEVANFREVAQMDLQIVGLGFSLRSFAQFVKKSLGIQERTISGEFLIQQDSLVMNLRLTGYYSDVLVNVNPDNPDRAIKQLIEKASEKIMYYMEPYQLAIYLQDNKDHEAFLDVIQYLINNKPKDKKWAYNLWGNYLDRNDGDKAGAAKKYLEAIAIDSTFRLPYSNYGFMLYNMDSLELAEKYITRAMELEKSYLYGNKILADIKFKQGKEEEALEMYKKAESYIGQPWQVAYNLGRLYSDLGRFAEATPYYKKAVELNPLSSDALDMLIECYRLTGDFQSAIAYANHYEEYYPQYSAGYMHKTVTYVMSGKPDSAEIYLALAEPYGQQMHLWFALKSALEVMKGENSAAALHMDMAIEKGFDPRQFAQNPLMKQMMQLPEFKEMAAKKKWDIPAG